MWVPREEGAERGLVKQLSGDDTDTGTHAVIAMEGWLVLLFWLWGGDFVAASCAIKARFE